jgi:transcriptional regulator with XRE-family HTH domain
MAAAKKLIPSDVWPRRLKEARLAAGLSQRELGIAAGIDASVASTRVNRYELGVHKADYQIAVQLAQVLAVPVAYLYCDDEALASVLLAFHRASPSMRRRVQAILHSSSASSET